MIIWGKCKEKLLDFKKHSILSTCLKNTMFLSILFAFILLTTDAFPEGSSIFGQASQFNFTNHGTMTAKGDAIQHKYEAGSVQHVTKNECNIFYHKTKIITDSVVSKYLMDFILVMQSGTQNPRGTTPKLWSPNPTWPRTRPDPDFAPITISIVYTKKSEWIRTEARHRIT